MTWDASRVLEFVAGQNLLVSYLQEKLTALLEFLQAGGLPPGEEGRNVDHIALKIRPYDEAAILEHLSSHNVEASTAAKLYGAEGTGPAIRIKDPEGNGLELKGPAA